METLEKTNPHFIRCIKSNNHKAPCQFDKELVLRQLRYTGMVQTVKIRKAGYSVRMNFEVHVRNGVGSTVDVYSFMLVDFIHTYWAGLPWKAFRI